MFYSSKYFNNLVKNDPICLIDVGARGGINKIWEPIISNLSVLGFEPDNNECDRLNEITSSNFRFLPIGLYKKRGEFHIQFNKNPATSSIYLPNYSLVNRFQKSDHYIKTNDIIIKCDTLDNVITKENINDVDFLKLDTQGSELDILMGAKSTLERNIIGVNIEVEFSMLYIDQPLFSDVDNYLRGFGFRLFDINLARLNRKNYSNKYSKGQVLWGHAIYLKDYIDNKDNHYLEQKFEKALKILAISEIHGFYDFALELLDYFHHSRIINKENYKKIHALIMDNDKQKSFSEYDLIKGIYSYIKQYIKTKFHAK